VSSIIALDIGERRIGVAVAKSPHYMPQPLVTLSHDAGFTAQIQVIINQHQADTLVVGLPRGLSGEDTQQTQYTRRVVEALQEQIDVPIHLQDEAGTSARAKDILRMKNKKVNRTQNKGEIDALAASIILEDYITDNQLAHGAKV
jgi:putative holliday junction resolvase